jgi:hypothetical protein
MYGKGGENVTKIDQINETIAMQATKRPTASTPTPFQASLENALFQKIPENADRKQASALSEPQSPIVSQPGASSTNIVGQTDRLLGLLESYAIGLENPGASLKELASIVALMKDEARQLMASTDMRPEGGSDINGIAAKAALTANVEYIKFHRGDYI